MEDKKTSKKQIKFYSDLSAEDREDIVYLPDVLKSEQNSKNKSTKDTEELSQSRRMASSDSSFNTVGREAHSLRATAEKKDIISFPDILNAKSSINIQNSLPHNSEGEVTGGFQEAPVDGEKNTDSLLKNSGNELSSLSRIDKEKPYYELLEKEKNTILYLPDFFKKKRKRNLSYQKTTQNKGVVIPFPSTGPVSKPAAASSSFSMGLNVQNALAFACLLIVSGTFATAVASAIGNGSKKLVVKKIKSENKSKGLMLTLESKKVVFMRKENAKRRDVAQDKLIDKWIKQQAPLTLKSLKKGKRKVKITKAVHPDFSIR